MENSWIMQLQQKIGISKICSFLFEGILIFIWSKI